MLKSVRAKLFLTIAISIIIIILFFIIVNNVVIEKYYYYKKNENSLEAFDYIDSNFNGEIDEKLEDELNKMCLENGYDIIIKNDEEVFFANNDDYLDEFEELVTIKSKIKYSIFNKEKVMYSDGNVSIRLMHDKKYDMEFMILNGKLGTR